jgi:hypothetical protein
MIRKQKLFGAALVVLVLLFPTILSAQQNDPKAVALVQRWEDRLNVENLDITSIFTLVQKRENEPDRVLRVRIYRRRPIPSYTFTRTVKRERDILEKGMTFFNIFRRPVNSSTGTEKRISAAQMHALICSASRRHWSCTSWSTLEKRLYRNSKQRW